MSNKKSFEQLEAEIRSIEGLSENGADFLISSQVLGRKIAEGMCLATCVANLRLGEYYNIQEKVLKTVTEPYMNDIISVLTENFDRHKALQNLVLLTRDETEKALGFHQEELH